MVPPLDVLAGISMLEVGDLACIVIDEYQVYHADFSGESFHTDRYYDAWADEQVDRVTTARFYEPGCGEDYLIFATRNAETERWNQPILYRTFPTDRKEERLGDVANVLVAKDAEV